MASAAFTTGSERHRPQTSSSDHVCATASSFMPGTFEEDPDAFGTPQQYDLDSEPAAAPKPAKHWPPRTCRICLETVQPTYTPASINLPDALQLEPSVTYNSSDPEAGRLIRPCTCRGSSKYVHEGCLQLWRHADPDYAKRNYWQCPTCGFQYRLERMNWGRWVSSTATQVFLTITILFLAMFIAGFFADPVINLYLDPYGTISSASLFKWGSNTPRIIVLDEDDTFENASWFEHFIKGLASLGLLSFVKVLFALSPWQWWNLRNSGVIGGSGRAGANGRDRLATINWLVVMVGVGTFLWGVYKGVRAWSRRVLEKASERVMDVPLDHNDSDNDNDNDNDN